MSANIQTLTNIFFTAVSMHSMRRQKVRIKPSIKTQMASNFTWSVCHWPVEYTRLPVARSMLIARTDCIHRVHRAHSDVLKISFPTIPSLLGFSFEPIVVASFARASSSLSFLASNAFATTFLSLWSFFLEETNVGARAVIHYTKRS